MSGDHWIGVDLGGTKILAGLYDDSMTLLTRVKQPTGHEGGPEGVFARISQAVEAVVRESKVDPATIRGLGFGIAGQLEPEAMRVKFSPNLEWRDLDLKPLLPSSWTWPVVIENDVRMCTYGEWTLGAAKDSSNVFGIFVGTGVGGAILLDGKFHRGFNGNAGEVGHLVVNWRRRTYLEAIAGRKYQMRRAKELLDDAPKKVRRSWKGIDLPRMTSAKLAELVQAGDPVAERIVDDAARALAASIAGVVNLLSPELIVIGGGVTGSFGETFVERIWDLAQRSTLPGATENVRFVTAALGDDSGIAGCAAYARKLHNPS